MSTDRFNPGLDATQAVQWVLDRNEHPPHRVPSLGVPLGQSTRAQWVLSMHQVIPTVFFLAIRGNQRLFVFVSFFFPFSPRYQTLAESRSGQSVEAQLDEAKLRTAGRSADATIFVLALWRGIAEVVRYQKRGNTTAQGCPSVVPSGSR